MDVQLKELIEKIKSEGVKSAEDKAAEIIKSAENKAAEIISEANVKSSKIVSEANSESEKMIKSGKEALTQASRDLVLNLTSSIKDVFNTVINESTSSAYNSKVLEEAIVSLINNWAEKGVSDLQILLPENQLKDLESQLKTKLAEAFKKGLELKPSSKIEAGFKISQKDGAAFYDFSSEGLSEMLAEYLNPLLAEIIKNSVK